MAAASAFTPALLSAGNAAQTIRNGGISLGTRGGDLINAVVPIP